MIRRSGPGAGLPRGRSFVLLKSSRMRPTPRSPPPRRQPRSRGGRCRRARTPPPPPLPPPPPPPPTLPRLGPELHVHVPVDAGASRDQVPDDDVLLQPLQVVARAADGGVGQHPRGFLERGRGDERLRGQRGLGDAEQQRLRRGRLLPA